MKLAATGVNPPGSHRAVVQVRQRERRAPPIQWIVYADDTDGFLPDWYLDRLDRRSHHRGHSSTVSATSTGSPVIRSTTSNIVGGRYGPITIAGSTDVPFRRLTR